MIKKSLSNIKKSKTLEEIEKTKKEFKETSVTLILGGFGLMAALA